MKKLLLFLSVLFVFGAVSSPAQAKIGVVDADRVVQSSAKGKVFFAELKRFNDSKEKELNALVAAYRAREKDAQSRAASMSDDQRRQTVQDLQRMQTDIKRKQEDAQRESQRKLNAGLQKFQKELAPVIRKVALEMGLDLVLNHGASAGIVFVSERIDITGDVIRKYDGS